MNEQRRRRPDSRRGRGPRRPRREEEDTRNIRGMISEIEGKLVDSIVPESLTGLNSFERKLIHRHFDHNKDFQTRTYRNGDDFKLLVYPVGNLERFAREKAEESLQSGETINLPAMGSYERYLVHNSLKDFSGVETSSQGEGNERHIQITSKRFGRGLKKIVKKIKLL